MKTTAKQARQNAAELAERMAKEYAAEIWKTYQQCTQHGRWVAWEVTGWQNFYGGQVGDNIEETCYCEICGHKCAAPVEPVTTLPEDDDIPF